MMMQTPQTNKPGRPSPLHTVVRVLCLLLIFEQPLLAETEANDTEMLLKFSASGDVNSVKKLVEAGVDINSSDPVFKATALHNAAAEGHVLIIGWLLEQGASIEALDHLGSTPLIWAAYAGQGAATTLLLESGAEPNHVPVAGPTALIAGVQSGQHQVVRSLLNFGADVTLQDRSGLTPAAAAEATGHPVLLTLLSTAGGKQ